MATKKLTRMQERAQVKIDADTALHCCQGAPSLRALAKRARRVGLRALAKALTRFAQIEIAADTAYNRVERCARLTAAEMEA